MKTLFDLSPTVISLCFSSSTFVMAITVIVYKYVDWKVGGFLHLIIGTTLASFGLLLVAPTTFIGIPQKFFITILGMIIAGFAISLGNTAMVTSLISLCEEKYKDKNKSSINVICSGVYMASWMLAEIMGPIFGGLLTSNFGFGTGNLIWSSVSLCVVLAYVILGNGHSYIRKQFESNTKVKFNELVDEI